MTRRITHLIEEQKNKPELFNTRELDFNVSITLENPQKIEVPTSNKEEVLPLNIRK
jgi:hypothetical protein